MPRRIRLWELTPEEQAAAEEGLMELDDNWSPQALREGRPD